MWHSMSNGRVSTAAVWICIAVVVFERARIRKHRALVVALLVVLAVHNLTGGFWMMRSRSTDFNAVKGGWLLDHAGSGDVILTADGAVFQRYLATIQQPRSSVWKACHRPSFLRST
jgi:hypothetical protein